MSNTIRRYGCIETFPDGSEVSVTATVQGKYGAAVQFTMNNDFCVLAENQVRDLINVLQKRINRDKGYSATDWGDEEIVSPEVIEDEDEG